MPKKMLHSHEQSLSDLLGKKVAHVAGYISREFGSDTLVFKITRIIFEDGTHESVDGEHDIAYIPADNNETWEKHYKED